MPPAARAAGPTTCKMRAGRHLPMLLRVQLLSAAWSATNTATLNTLPDIIAKLVAISQAESAGYTEACNHNANGTYDFGFMQINTINGGSAASYDEATCAQQAINVYNRQGFKAWSTYGGARYLAALPAAKIAAARFAASTGAEGAPVGAGLAAAAKGQHDCVYGWSLPSLGPVGGEFICFDVILGGIKMAAGAFGAGISALALVFVVARSVPGGSEAVSATSRITSKLPAPAPVRAYRTVSRDRSTQRRSGEMHRERLARAQQVRQHADERHESQQRTRETRRLAVRLNGSSRYVDGPGRADDDPPPRPRTRARDLPDDPPF